MDNYQETLDSRAPPPNIYFSKLKFWNAIREFEIFMFKSTKRKPEGRRKNIFPSSFWSNKKHCPQPYDNASNLFHHF